jgi:hypothetical protein
MHDNLLWLGLTADVKGVEEFESIKVSKGTIDQSKNFLVPICMRVALLPEPYFRAVDGLI